MAIHDLLNDINDGITGNVNPELESNREGVLGLEGAKEIVQVTGNVKLNLSKLDNNIIDKFNTLYSRCLIRKALQGAKKVDRGVVLEAMATLPANSTVNQAKLTTAPSAINKKILDEIVFSEKDEVPADLHTFIIDTLKVLNDGTVKELDDLLLFITEYSGRVREQLNNKIKTSIVMNGNQSVNLLAEDIITITSIDDTKLMYPKYEGELNKRAKNILTEDFYTFVTTMREFNNSEKDTDYSVCGILNNLTMVEAILRGIRSSFVSFIDSANYYINQGNPELTGAANDAVEDLQRAITSSETYNKVCSVISEKSQFLEAIAEYVDFID